MTYFLSDGIKKWGPLSRDEIFDQLDAGQVSLFDLVCREDEHEFLPIMNHEDFTRESPDRPQDKKELQHVHGLISTGIENEYTTTRLKGVMDGDELTFSGLEEKTRTQAQSDDLKEEPSWFVQIKGQPEGPFSFLKVLGLLTSGQIQEFDKIRRGSGDWLKIAEVPDFQPENLKKFNETQMGPSLEGKSFRRAHPRVQLGKKIYVYNHKKFYKVVCVEVSQGGAGLLTGQPYFQVNDEILLKFRSDSPAEVFDAKGKVMSLRKVRVGNREEKYCRYGVQFLGLSEDGKRYLSEILKLEP